MDPPVHDQQPAAHILASLLVDIFVVALYFLYTDVHDVYDLLYKLIKILASMAQRWIAYFNDKSKNSRK